MRICKFCQSWLGGNFEFHCFSGLFGFVFISQPVQMMSFGGKMTRPFRSYSFALFQAGTFKVKESLAPDEARGEAHASPRENAKKLQVH